jgi:V8-like Glu-specific endopeptidase
MKWINLLAAVSAVTSLVAGTTQLAHSQETLAEQLSAPLPKSDPRAQLSSVWADAKPIQPPTEKGYAFPLTFAQGTTEVAYNLATRQTSFGTMPAAMAYVNHGQFAPLVSPGSIGLGGQSDEEPQRNGAQPGGGYSPNAIIGSDDRVRIDNTTSFPWRAQCKLYMRFPNGARYIGSGTLINAKYLLTAGHCVYSKSDGGWATQVEVVPGMSGSYKPYGSAYATRFRSYTGWTNYSSRDHDFALVTLDRNIGDSTGWLGYGTFSSLSNVVGNIAGYPGDRDGGRRLYYHYDWVQAWSNYRVFYNIDTMPGQSGSGVYRRINGGRYVFAVHTNGSSSGNSGTRIDGAKYNSISSWIASGN